MDALKKSANPLGQTPYLIFYPGAGRRFFGPDRPVFLKRAPVGPPLLILHYFPSVHTADSITILSLNNRLFPSKAALRKFFQT